MKVRSRRPEKLLPLLRFFPAPHYSDIDVKVVKHATERVIDNIVDRTGTVVKSRNGGRDQRAQFGRRRHRPEMAEMQRRFAYHEHKPPLFFQHDVCRSGE